METQVTDLGIVRDLRERGKNEKQSKTRKNKAKRGSKKQTGGEFSGTLVLYSVAVVAANSQREVGSVNSIFIGTSTIHNGTCIVKTDRKMLSRLRDHKCHHWSEIRVPHSGERRPYD
jgi:hypothetical protein